MNRKAAILAGLVLMTSVDGWAAVKAVKTAKVVRVAQKMEVRSSIDVDSSVPATLFLDGEQIGETPLRISALAPGKHTLEAVALAGGQSMVETLAIPMGASIERAVVFDFRPIVLETARVYAPRPIVVVHAPRRLVVYAPYYARPSRYYGRRSYHHGRRRW